MTDASVNVHAAVGKIRGALIGCGFFSRNHLQGWREIDGVEIVALCDANEERLRMAGAAFGIERLYGDAAALLESERLDFVDIATTAPSHRALVELAARHRVAVICQKPFALSMNDAEAMVAVCRQADVPLMVHENFRWQRAIRAVGRVLAEGEIGTPFWGRISFRSAFDVFSGQPYLARNPRFIVEDLGIHVLDIARYLFSDVQRLSATTARVNPDIAGEDVATILLQHVAGATSIVDCSYATRLPQERFPQTLVEVDGSEGTLRLFADYRLQVHGRRGTREELAAPTVYPWSEAPWHAIQDSVVGIQSHWIDCLTKRIEPSTSGRDNLKTLALVDATYRSAETGQGVVLGAPAPAADAALNSVEA